MVQSDHVGNVSQVCQTCAEEVEYLFQTTETDTPLASWGRSSRLSPASAGLGLLPGTWDNSFRGMLMGPRYNCTHCTFELWLMLAPTLRRSCARLCLGGKTDKYPIPTSAALTQKKFIPFTGHCTPPTPAINSHAAILPASMDAL